MTLSAREHRDMLELAEGVKDVARHMLARFDQDGISAEVAIAILASCLAALLDRCPGSVRDQCLELLA